MTMYGDTGENNCDKDSRHDLLAERTSVLGGCNSEVATIL